MLYEVVGTVTIKGKPDDSPDDSPEGYSKPTTVSVPTFYMSADDGIEAALTKAKQVINPTGSDDITPHLCITSLFENSGEPAMLTPLTEEQAIKMMENLKRLPCFK